MTRNVAPRQRDLFLWRRVLPYLVSMLLAFAVIGVLDGRGALGSTWDWLEPLLGVFTAVTAFFIWIGEYREDRVAALPRRLSVSFEFGGEPVFVEEQAFLAHEADARQIAQQIGRQANGGKILAFDAAHIVERRRGPEPSRDGAGKVYCLNLAIELLKADEADVLREYAERRKRAATPPE